MSLISFPFNFNPDSVTVETGSYTVPAGKYAYVTVDLSAGGSFTIDGDTAVSLPAEQDDNVTAVNGTSYTVPSGYEFHGSGYAGGASGGAGTITVGGTTILSSEGDGSAGQYFHSSGPVMAGSGAVISGSGTRGFSGFAKRENRRYDNCIAHFWVPTGTQLNESGSVRYTVQLFNEVS